MYYCYIIIYLVPVVRYQVRTKYDTYTYAITIGVASVDAKDSSMARSVGYRTENFRYIVR